MEEVYGSMQTYAGVSVVNAIPSWYGSSMAIDLKVEVTIEESKECISHTPLVDKIVDYFREYFNIPCLRVKVNSEIPPRSGLKSSSAVSTALIAEIAKKFDIKINPAIYSAMLSIMAKVSVTGALDDATASYFGGVSFTYNKEFKILEVREPPELSVILLPYGNRSISINVDEMRKFRYLFEEVFNMARKGDIITAMKINGLAVGSILGYDLKPATMALKAGALAAGISGNGPSVFAVTKPGDEGPIIDVFEQYDNPIVTRVVGICKQRLEDLKYTVL